jgi:hypothetical protein
MDNNPGTAAGERAGDASAAGQGVADRYAPYFAPYLYIWGTQWIADAVLQYVWLADSQPSVRLILVGAALLLTLGWAAGGARRGTRRDGTHRTGRATMLPPAALALFAAALFYAKETHLFFADVFRAVFLALFYVLIGGLLRNKPLLWLGLWLFALCVVMAVFYLGYAPAVLGFFGGASLLVCAAILRRSAPQDRRRAS